MFLTLGLCISKDTHIDLSRLEAETPYLIPTKKVMSVANPFAVQGVRLVYHHLPQNMQNHISFVALAETFQLTS